MTNLAIFGAGCFWCIEACFKDIKGVVTVEPGYCGGDESTANYKDVCSGLTKHAEVAKIEFDPRIVTYGKLLELFWFVHDPTQLNRQGNDVGPQYRSVIFSQDEKQNELALKYKEDLNNSGAWKSPVVTEVEEAKPYYSAEKYHNNYLENNPENPYCQSIVRPKVDKFRKVFSELIE